MRQGGCGLDLGENNPSPEWKCAHMKTFLNTTVVKEEEEEVE